MKKVVLATGNEKKRIEMQQTLSKMELDIIMQKELDVPEAEENGLSFIENALIKARNAAYHTQLPAIADDSGLCVDALSGAPGIYSSRYAESGKDEDNNQKLLHELSSHTQREAQFYCALVYVKHAKDPTPIIAIGLWRGLIAKKLKGKNGFGYDPLFFVPEYQCHAAELDSTIKQKISHRGQALQQLHRQLNRSTV